METDGQKETSGLRVLQFTDTLADINGVCRFIQNVAQMSHDTDRSLFVFTSTRLEMPDVDHVVNFEPIYARAMPGYETLELAIPPMISMLRAAEDFEPDVIHISTPGPVGMVGMLAAKLMHKPIVGVYHTDFPAYIDELFENRFCSWLCRAQMSVFYRQFRAVFSRSADYAQRLETIGLKPERLVRLRPGFDNTRFDSSLRDPSIWEGFGLGRDSIKAMFCGRVSSEKNLPMLARNWETIRQAVETQGHTIELVIVGDGPYRGEMQEALSGHGVSFLGFRHGQELAKIYASCDFFVFPSTTDTLGQVVMEAQASGLPVLISDQGGPKEVVVAHDAPGSTGMVLPGDGESDWVQAVVRLACDDELRKTMGRNGIKSMGGYSFEESYLHYWAVHERVAAQTGLRVAQTDSAADQGQSLHE